MPRPTALYTISPAVQNKIPALIGTDIQSGLKEFVIAIVNYASEHDTLNLSRAELTAALAGHLAPPKKPGGERQALSTANSMISRRVKELTTLGCMRVNSEYRLIENKRRKCSIHELVNLTGLISFLQERPIASPSPQGRPKLNDLVVYSDALEGEGITKLQADGDVVPYTEGAFSILESAARSRSDTDNVIKCKYHIKKDDFVNITASTSTKKGAGIMYSSDQRVIQALNGMLKQANYEIQNDLFEDAYPAKLIGEYCFFDLYALTREIGLAANVRENRDNVLKMVDRLKETTFDVDATNSEYWRERYMPGPQFNKGVYRYIQECYSAEDWSRRAGTDSTDWAPVEDRFFVVKFHPLILKGMTTARLAFISHESLKSERLDIVHRLNNWVKPVVGVRDRGYSIDHHQYTLDIFHQRVRPASRLDNFERQFYNMIKRQDGLEDLCTHDESVRFHYDENENVIPEGVFWLNGYYYRVEMNHKLAQEIHRKTRTVKRRRRKEYPVITIWRDRNDEIVGDESAHNQALKRQQKELFEDDIYENDYARASG